MVPKPIRYHEPVLSSRRHAATALCFSCLFGLLLLTALPFAAPVRAAEEPISDDLLYDRVNRALITDRELGARPLTIEVVDGKVTVSGYVETEKLRDRVEKVVKKVKGVREVDNRVQIRR